MGEDAPCFVEQAQWLLRVQDVEEHDVLDGAIAQPGAVGDEVPPLEADIAQACLVGKAFALIDHCSLDVEAMKGAANTAGGGQREGPVATAEVHRVAGLGGQAQRVEDGLGIEEGAPHDLVGHAALARFHGRSLHAWMTRPIRSMSALLPLASPFSKSFSTVAMRLVTWAKQRIEYAFASASA